MGNLINTAYYQIKPFIPRRLQIYLRRKLALAKRRKHVDSWPILPHSDDIPERFSGWPERKRFALILTHDVDTAEGHSKCIQLMKLEERLGFRSSFNFVPERYRVSTTLRNRIVDSGFEVGVHGLNHDGKLLRSKTVFKNRSLKINRYLKRWKATGFRAPAMHHNLEWFHMLDIDYDASTFDTDPFEPQSDGCGTIFPFWVHNGAFEEGYVELPYTLPQDFTVLVLMQDHPLSIWKRKLEWLAGRGGMVLLNTHPDYMSFQDYNCRFDQYHVSLYENFLKALKAKYSGQYWHTLPKNIAKFWRESIVGVPTGNET